MVGKINESDINLDISLRLKKYLENLGYCVDMTRTDSGGLTDESGNWNKENDMQLRKNMILSGDYDVFVSIHQNSHQDTSCRGGQVFYSDNNAQNAVLAEILQKKLKECATFENKRACLINNDYKLLKENSMPSVIVECGFMTNSAELQLLLTENYREKTAMYLAEGIKNYIENKK